MLNGVHFEVEWLSNLYMYMYTQSLHDWVFWVLPGLSG